MKTPSDFGIDPYGGRNGKGIYGTKWISYYDAEDYIERCRTRFAVDVYHAKPLPRWDGATQQFLVMAREVWENGGDDALQRYFSEFADYVILHLPLYERIDEWQDYNSRVIAYNDYVCEQSNGTIQHTVTHPDYYRELLDWFPQNWETYWKWCGSDSQRCGGDFKRYYSFQGERDGWGEREKRFYELAQVFVDKIKAEHAKRPKKRISGSDFAMCVK